ncbi:hypothetical protein C7S16_7011 [Burkholderia thailandensis]|uniref:Uncharacterized protein n=1 Tax=Burkholderia thailandensis TaxID=57975 RepID=A0AAW9CR42_BURTH|nr:hypothetical protein [Burkholderia thailandensis]MDW9251074.1 hypothetical protein [Burkholderia thailandensis]
MFSATRQGRRDCIDLVYRYSKSSNREIKWAFTRVRAVRP